MDLVEDVGLIVDLALVEAAVDLEAAGGGFDGGCGGGCGPRGACVTTVIRRVCAIGGRGGCGGFDGDLNGGFNGPGIF